MRIVQSTLSRLHQFAIALRRRTPLGEVLKVRLRSRDHWVKVVDMLQQNWALVEPLNNGQVEIVFLTDHSGIFDRISPAGTQEEAFAALRRNGFERFAEDPRLKEFLAPPEAPYFEATHPNGPIYSSGRYWRGAEESTIWGRRR